MELSTERFVQKLVVRHERVNKLLRLARGSATETLPASFRRLKPAQQSQLAEAVAELNSVTAEVQRAISGNQTAASNTVGRPTSSFSDVQSIESGELVQLITELMSDFESSVDYDMSTGANWISPNGSTEVVHIGSCSAFRSTLIQDPDAVFNEYRVLHCGVPVFSWSDRLWPELSQEKGSEAWCSLPVDCLYDLIAFHRQYKTRWIDRWVKQELSAVDETRPGITKVDKVNVMPKLNVVKLTKQQLHVANG